MREKIADPQLVELAEQAGFYVHEELNLRHYHLVALDELNPTHWVGPLELVPEAPTPDHKPLAGE